MGLAGRRPTEPARKRTVVDMTVKRLAVALGVGYVLGAKAGRDRYDDLVDLWDKVSGSPVFEGLADRAKDAYDRARDALEDRARAGTEESDADDEEGHGGRARRMLRSVMPASPDNEDSGHEDEDEGQEADRDWRSEERV